MDELRVYIATGNMAYMYVYERTTLCVAKQWPVMAQEEKKRGVSAYVHAHHDDDVCYAHVHTHTQAAALKM